MRYCKKYKLGLIGTGRITENRIWPALGKIGRFKVIGAYDADEEVASHIPEKFNVPALPSVDDLLSLPCDAVYIATPNCFHAELAIRALQSGKAVLIEKPCGHTLTAAESIQTAVQQTKGIALVAYMAKWNRYNQLAQQLISENRIGDIQFIDAAFGFYLSNTAAWRLKRKLSGAGALADLGIYEITTALDILDQMPASCSAIASPAGDPEWGDRFFSGRLNFRNGCQVQMTASFFNSVCGYTIIGSQGSISVSNSWYQNGDGQLVLFTDHHTELMTTEVINPYEAELLCLAECLDGKTVPPQMGIGNAVRDIRVLDSLDRSAAIGQAVLF